MTSPVSIYSKQNNLHWRIFCDCAEERNVVFYYEGYFSQTIITAVADAVKIRIEHVGATTMTRRKLFSSFIEMTQNIIHYSDDAHVRNDQPNFSHEVRHGSICISAQADRYYLHCANPVRTDVAAQLREKLNYLHTLTIDDIKREYRQTLRSETSEYSKGAGLGLLTMARDAREPLEFEFMPIRGSQNVLFYLKATI